MLVKIKSLETHTNIKTDMFLVDFVENRFIFRGFIKYVAIYNNNSSISYK